MKKIRCFFLFALLITACSSTALTPSSTSPASRATVAVATAIPSTNIPTMTSTATSTETATAVPVLALDATKSPSEWDISIFTAEQQAWLTQVMTDPDHAPIEAKNFYDRIRVEGIKLQTGDTSYHIDADPLVNSAQIGKYTEYAWAHKIREIAPLPFAWRKDSLGTLDNFPVWNDKGRPGYLIEGFEWLGHDPNYGTPNQLYSSVERSSTNTGVGENISNFTPEAEAAYQQNRINIGHNQERDTIFGDPFLITFPWDAIARGDLMLLTQIAGVNPDTAQEAVIRMYGQDGLPRYGIIRMQYAEEIIQAGDNSCMTIKTVTSRVCAPGTKLLPSNIFKLEIAPQRVNGIVATRAKMIELMNMTEFQHPIRITLSGYPYFDSGDFNFSTFMDGAKVAWDIKTPTVPLDFFK